jgi:hypothetical protein
VWTALLRERQKTVKPGGIQLFCLLLHVLIQVGSNLHVKWATTVTFVLLADNMKLNIQNEE